jgi:hypothetical protein
MKATLASILAPIALLILAPMAVVAQTAPSESAPSQAAPPPPAPSQAAPPQPATDPAAAAATDATPDGEPLPADAPTEPYALAAWCYGAMDQYLYIYQQILPQLRDIDRLFGTSVQNEAEPYSDDMAAAKVELGVLKNAVQSAEKASLKVISPEGARWVSQGRGIWGPAETHTRRELARAWLSWALPDRCDTNARELAAKSDLLGQVLKYNGPSATESPPAPVKIAADDDGKTDASAGASAGADPIAEAPSKPAPTPDAPPSPDAEPSPHARS